MSHHLFTALALFLLSLATFAPARAGEAPALTKPLPARFAPDLADVDEVPDFQRHVLPLMGRLGCNTRSCHGSFQGRGGFRLSLFGYDFQADHDALLKNKPPRVDVETPELSKILQKPTLAIPHKGGKRMDEGSWAYRVLARWIEAGAKGVENPSRFSRLEITPAELVFKAAGESVPLKVVAHWADGSSEDVTAISRFRTNDESVADVSEDGLVTSKGPGDTHVVAFYDNGVAVAPALLPASDKTGPNYPAIPTPTRIDALVVDKLRKLGVVPSDLCSDAEFLRRASIDLTGSLPAPDEVEAFLKDPSPDRRAAKVDELLARPTYSAYWAAKLCDITGASPRAFNGQTANDKFARHWYEWTRRRIDENLPYDQLVAGILLASSRDPGQSYDDYTKTQAAYYRDDAPTDFTARPTMPYFWARRNLNTPDEKALAVSYAFLGVRLECAQCHKHPFDQWTQDDFKQFTAFFAPIRYNYAPDARPRVAEMRKELGLDKVTGGNVQRETARLAKLGTPIPWQEVFLAPVNRPNVPRLGPNATEKQKTNAAQAAARRLALTPKLLGGNPVDLAPNDDPRPPLMAWMQDPKNPYFARAFVNRVWANHFGRGIVHPADDMNQANPPSNAPLLDDLAARFVAHGFDVKWLHREILNSQAYQRSFRGNDTNRLDDKNFSRAVVRRLPAEVLLDAIQLATASSRDLAASTTPAGLEERAIGPKAGAGLPRRGPGAGDFASRVFGRSLRETNCDCSTSNEPNLLQSIFLQNDQEVSAAIDRRAGWLDERTGIVTRYSPRALADAEKAVAAIESRVTSLAARVASLQAEGEPQSADENPSIVLNDAEKLLIARRADLAQAQARLDVLKQAGPPPPFVADELVRLAYLRTLSRPPTPDELARSVDHIEAAGTPARGLRDLLWALLNTKEFATNH